MSDYPPSGLVRLLDAERNYQRNQKLAADGAISRQVLDTAQTRVTPLAI